MKRRFFLLNLFLISHVLLIAQQIGITNSNSYSIDKIFVDGANVRSEASVQSEILGKLKHNTMIERAYNTRAVKDTVNGKEGYWIGIKYQEQIAYIWNKVFANAVFKSRLNIKDYFLVNYNSEDVLAFKIFNTDGLIYEKNIQEDALGYLSGVYTYGKVPGNNKVELLVVLYYNEEERKNLHILFEWNGTEITKSNYKLKDESYLTGEYKKFEDYIVNADNVSLRKEPNLDAEKVAVLSKNTFVQFVKEDTVRRNVKMGNEYGSWLKIKKGVQVGFVWSRFISIPTRYFDSNFSEYSFLTTTHGMYVLKGKEIVGYNSTVGCDGEDIFYEKGNMGLTADVNIIAVDYFGGSCGKYSGEKLWAWNGKNIISFGDNGGVGDGGLSEGTSLVFPVDDGNLLGEIRKYSYNGESLMNPFSQEEEDYEFTSYQEADNVYKYNGDTLVIQESTSTKLQDIVDKNYKSYKITLYREGNLNNDQFDDVLCLIAPQEKNNYYDYSMPKKPILLVLTGNKKDSYDIVDSNKSMFTVYYSSTVFDFDANGFNVVVRYNEGYYDNEKNRDVLKFSFNYDKKDKQIYWKSKSVATAEDDQWNPEWKIETATFNKNKIAFKDVWVE